ncbi:MAG: ABC transporter permease [Polyangiaceae bacterium]|nr:ABC transporter permease [Polyangiaceae bacterium]
MTKALLIARREMHAYLRSPLGGVVIAATLLIEGIYFYAEALTKKGLSADVLTEFFYGFTAAEMIVPIVLTMRLIAEERQTGTFTLVNTAPVSEADVVVGKFLSAFSVIVIMTALSVYMPLLIFVNGKVSVGQIVVGYLGLLLLGSACVSLGLFASSLTRSQAVAAIVGAAITLAMILLWVVARATDPPLNEFFSALALHHENQKPFMQGSLQLGGVAYYLAVTYVFLLGAIKVLEARRWR